MFLLAEVDPITTINFGAVTALIATAVHVYRDMRKDMAEEKKRCANDIARLQGLLDDLKTGPCIKKNCPLYKQD